MKTEILITIIESLPFYCTLRMEEETWNETHPCTIVDCKAKYTIKAGRLLFVRNKVPKKTHDESYLLHVRFEALNQQEMILTSVGTHLKRMYEEREDAMKALVETFLEKNNFVMKKRIGKEWHDFQAIIVKK